MNVSKYIFLSVSFFTSGSMVGMGLAKHGGLIAKQVARLARLNTTKATGLLLPAGKEVFKDGRDSITILKEKEEWCKRIYTERLDVCMLTALYIRSRGGLQYASLGRDYDLLQHIEYIKDSMRTGVEVCTHQGDAVEQMVAIHTVPVGKSSVSSDVTSHDQEDLMDDTQEMAEEYVPIFKRIESTLDTTASQYLTFPLRVFANRFSLVHLEQEESGFELLLFSDFKQSGYQNTISPITSEKNRKLILLKDI